MHALCIESREQTRACCEARFLRCRHRIVTFRISRFGETGALLARTVSFSVLLSSFSMGTVLLPSTANSHLFSRTVLSQLSTISSSKSHFYCWTVEHELHHHVRHFNARLANPLHHGAPSSRCKPQNFADNNSTQKSLSEWNILLPARIRGVLLRGTLIDFFPCANIAEM